MQIKALEKFFNPKSVAVIGASREEKKIGQVIFKNLITLEQFGVKVFPINPFALEILGRKCYKSVFEIPGRVDLAVIAIPAKSVPGVVEECGEKGIRNVIIISAGFGEVGELELEKQLETVLKKYGIACLGPNCLGVIDSYSGIDTFFHPLERLRRPEKGEIAFIAQSGAVCSTILDLAVAEGFKFSKIISYGNALNVDESDLLEFLSYDKKTKIICLYIEGVKDGKKFFSVAKRAAKRKKIIILKGGKTPHGAKAAVSHTGILAGEAKIYSGAFKQCGLIEAKNLSEFYDFLRAFEFAAPCKGNRIQIITNGGGFGILTSDEITNNNLKMAELTRQSVAKLKKFLPKEAVVANPIDILGDATTARYYKTIETCLKDPNNDILIVIILPQVPEIEEDIIDCIAYFKALKQKPVFVIATGSEFTEKIGKALIARGVPVFAYPESAIRAISAVVEYYRKI